MKTNTKTVINRIKSKWFIYFLIAIVCIAIWFVYYGRVSEPPRNNVLYVWVTEAEQSDTLEENNLQIDQIMLNFEDKYADYGFTDYKTIMQDLDDNEKVIMFNNYAQFDLDFVIVPISVLKNDDYCNLFTDLSYFGVTHPLGEEGFIQVEHKDAGRKVSIGFIINEDYAFAIPTNYTMPDGVFEQIIQEVTDIVYPNG